jgi:Protein of unknown function (DUF1579)
MRLKYLRPRPGRFGIGKWSLLALVVAAATAASVAASVALTGAGSAGALAATGIENNQAGSTAILNPPAHQMAELDFMLGEYRCLTTPLPKHGRLTVYETTRKILDGNYYQMVQEANIPGDGIFTAYLTYGWDSVDHNYIVQYFDNVGSSGTATSPGWQGGHLLFPGQYVNVVTPGGVNGMGKGERITDQEDFVIVGPRHYIDSSSVLQNGQWIKYSAFDCQKLW